MKSVKTDVLWKAKYCISHFRLMSDKQVVVMLWQGRFARPLPGENREPDASQCNHDHEV